MGPTSDETSRTLRLGIVKKLESVAGSPNEGGTPAATSSPTLL